jgi:hypothetical protein
MFLIFPIIFKIACHILKDKGATKGILHVFFGLKKQWNILEFIGDLLITMCLIVTLLIPYPTFFQQLGVQKLIIV